MKLKTKKINLLLILIAIIGTVIMVVIKGQSFILTIKDLSIIITINGYYILSKIFKLKVNEKINFLYILFIFIAHFLGVIVNLYDKIYWFDKFAHFLSGVATSVLMLIILVKTNNYKSNFFTVLYILSFTSLVASYWEIFEYLSSVLFGLDPQRVLLTGVNDTMGDIIVATLGSMLVSVYYYYNKTKVVNIIKNV